MEDYHPPNMCMCFCSFLHEMQLSETTSLPGEMPPAEHMC